MLETYDLRNLPHLPINDCLARLVSVLAKERFAVLIAAPGAGKTTRVPLALLDQKWLKGQKILMLEPRRLAARSAAYHIAGLLNERPGQTIGYRIRMETCVSEKTRLEIVTDGVFTRMIVEDPELAGVGAVLFDEFHERSLDGDIGMALALETAEAFRPDLRILPMSATLDGAKIASLLEMTVGNPVEVIESKGKTYPVSIQYLPRPQNDRLEDSMAAAIKGMLAETDGSILCFLPGKKEIDRTFERLEKIPFDTTVHTLYGSLDPKLQNQAVQTPPAGHRKIILATSIAETSITIDGVTAVIDSGYSRVPVYEASTGLTRLQTVRSSKATITQRAGRAGRTAPGIALRLWREGQTNALPDYERPEILEADLTNLLLDLASWGVSDPHQLKWLDEPPQQSIREARSLLITLGAINRNGAITNDGKKIRSLALPPRLGHMMISAAHFGSEKDAGLLSVILGERGLGGTDIDLSVRFEKLTKATDSRAVKAKQLAARYVEKIQTFDKSEGTLPEVSSGVLVSFAWPERIAQRMQDNSDGDTYFRLANGRRARMSSVCNLSKCDFIVITELQGNATSSRIFGAVSISLEEIREHHKNAITTHRKAAFDKTNDKFQVRTEECLGAVILSTKNSPITANDDIPTLLVNYLKDNDFEKIFTSGSVASFQKRAQFYHSLKPDTVPSFTKTALQEDLNEWLLPMIPAAKSLKDINPETVLEALKIRLGFENLREFEAWVPSKYQLPSGNFHKLDYGEDQITLRARVQEFYGLKEHPSILNKSFPLTLELLSPAMRPIQKTKDLPGFWTGSWRDVQKEMKGRYPKHVWPDDPENAMPTTRAKPRS